MRTVLISVAHSARSPGAQNRDMAASEYLISQRATLSCYRGLTGIVPVELYDAGPLSQSQYDDAKVECVNSCMPALAVEIHLNSSENVKANYGEVIYHRNSPLGKEAAEHVMHSLAMLFATKGPTWRAAGARPNVTKKLVDEAEAAGAKKPGDPKDKDLFFFLERTRVPSIIVEGLFVSNRDHADWLVNGGQDYYGTAVADGIKRFLGIDP